MIIDKFLELSDKQAVTASTPSTHTIDFGQAKPNTGMDDRSKMVITVDESVISTNNNTRLRFAIRQSANGTSWGTAAESPPYSKSALTEGAQFVLAMPTRLLRYCRIDYAVSGEAPTAGKFSARIVTGIQQNDPYPDSPNIA